MANLLSVYERAQPWEREDGRVYYDRQRGRLEVRALVHSLTLSQVVAAFCALSPNNSEKITYRSLDTCLEIVRDPAAGDHKRSVPAYGTNKEKALALLRGRAVESILSGPKVVAFYYNTMNPDDSGHVTVDGHMLGAWTGTRIRLKGPQAKFSLKEYHVIADGVRVAAARVDLAAPRFQSILWLTWKRLHGILWTPQMRFRWEGD